MPNGGQTYMAIQNPIQNVQSTNEVKITLFLAALEASRKERK